MAAGESRWKRWSTSTVQGALQVSNWAGAKANAAGEKFGTERFWPTSNDAPLEIEKCERILRQFTVQGIPEKEPGSPTSPADKKRKVFRKIPASVLQDAKGLVIFTAMRTGIAPISGAGGSGIVMARLPNGSWSPPSFVSPNNFAAGFMLGIDVYDVVLVLRTAEAVEGFRTHHFTIGGEMAVAAGPFGGSGASMESGLKKRTPIYSYVSSKGFYAGVEMVGQVFIDRFDENERFYRWPGIKAGDVLSGKVKMPHEAEPLLRTILEAELGQAQGSNTPPDLEITTLDLLPGETLRLPPTPEQLKAFEAVGIPDEDDLVQAAAERERIKILGPPPRHPHTRNSMKRDSDDAVMRGDKGMFSTLKGASSKDSAPSPPARNPRRKMDSPAGSVDLRTVEKVRGSRPSQEMKRGDSDASVYEEAKESPLA